MNILKNNNIKIQESILSDVKINFVIQVGKFKMKIKDLFNILPDQLLFIDKINTELLDIIVNNMLIAKGELVSYNNKYAIRIVKIINKDKSII